MQFQNLTTAAGDEFWVPEYIVRVDDEGLCGWQLRYGEWTDYPDHPGGKSGSERALGLALTEMQFRMDTLGK